MGSLRGIFPLALAAGAWASASAANADEGALHALYVGVADYKYGTPEGEFRDLEGAPSDIATIRAALEKRAGFSSVTVLRDAEAGREAILAALDAFASGAKGAPGETLVFYYTGHGARAVDMSGSQADSFHSTLVPWDARGPEVTRRGESGDILDVELRERFDAITARGMNVVTIFDSCNSGTATRAHGRSKSAPDARVRASSVTRSPPVPGSDGTISGYRVHFAAAVDNSEAFEDRDSAGIWRSDFTVALAQAIAIAPPDTSYREVFDAARSGVGAKGKNQLPRTEGAVLTRFLAPRRKTERLFAVRVDAAGQLTLQGGALSLVDTGTQFALYRSLSEANAAGSPPIGMANVVSAGPATATLDASLAGASELVAREVVPAKSAAPLAVAVADPSAISAVTRAAIERRPNLTIGNGAYRIASVTSPAKTGDVEIMRADGTRIATVAPGAALADALNRIARHDALVALDGRGEGLQLRLSYAEKSCDGGSPLPFAHDGGTARISLGDSLRVGAKNPLPDDPLFLQLLYLGADYSVSLIDPAPFSEPVAWAAGACAAWKITPDKKGTHRFLLMASTMPLPGTSTLEQGGLAEVGPEVTQVAHAQGTRSSSAWAVSSLTVHVD